MNPTEAELAEVKSQLRHALWRLKLLGKQSGKQGWTIYTLRNEVAALREATQWTPGDRARLLASYQEAVDENERLREKLRAKAES